MLSSRLVKVIFAVVITVFAAPAFSGDRAITGTGDVGILDSDGTWKYDSHSVKRVKTVKTSHRVYRPLSTCDYPFGNQFDHIGLWVDPIGWRNRGGGVTPPQN